MNADILEKVINSLINSDISNYRISMDTGISDETIANYRKGKSKPRGANLKVLAKYLGLTQGDNASEIVLEDKLNIDDMDIKVLLDVIKRQNARLDELEKENAELRRKCEPSEERPGA